MLSIIIPTYNSATLISRALESVIVQTYTDWEILVMDGASSDETISLASSYNDSRIQVFSEKDKGVYDAMNKGIIRAKGDWLYFLGSDDYLVDKTVLSKVFERNLLGISVLYGEVEAEHLGSLYRGEWNWNNLCACRCHQAIFYRREVFELCGLYNLKYKVCADYDLNLKWYFDSRICSKYIDVTIAHYSDGGLSAVAPDDAFARDYDKMILYRGYSYLTLHQKLSYIKRIITKNYTHSGIMSMNRKGR